MGQILRHVDLLVLVQGIVAGVARIVAAVLIFFLSGRSSTATPPSIPASYVPAESTPASRVRFSRLLDITVFVPSP